VPPIHHLRIDTMKALTLFLAMAAAPCLAAADSITIQAGNHERSGTIISFQAPDSMKGQTVTLHGSGTPVQVDDTGRATFILTNKLSKGDRATFTFAPALPIHNAAGVTAKQDGSLLIMDARSYAITPNSKPVPMFSYQMQAGDVPAGVSPVFKHGAHLHPVFSPSGKLVTGNHPSDHRWHRGIWFAWTNTDFEGRHVDFWNLGKSDSKGKDSGKLLADIRFDKLVRNWSGPVHGGFVSEHRWLDLSSGAEKDVLRETWNVTAYHTLGLNDPQGNRLPALFIIDLVSTQTCAGSTPLKLPKYHYGGLGVRGNELWNPVDAVKMLTSNGDDRIKGDATKGKWVWLGGEVEGKTCGITVLMHPSNFRFPQPMRLNPSNPQICIAPSQGGDWAIEPGKPYVSRYRILISDDKPDAKELERQWLDYAEPPEVVAK
jgi:hypothetical protein